MSSAHVSAFPIMTDPEDSGGVLTLAGNTPQWSSCQTKGRRRRILSIFLSEQSKTSASATLSRRLFLANNSRRRKAMPVSVNHRAAHSCDCQTLARVSLNSSAIREERCMELGAFETITPKTGQVHPAGQAQARPIPLLDRKRPQGYFI